MQINKSVKRPALRYYGSKWALAPWIISHFPKHTTYIEPCGGGASVLLRKPVSKMEVYNDLDSDVVNFFRVLREEKEQFIEKLKLTPFSREEFEICRGRSDDSIENARRFFVGCWLSISNQPYERATGFSSPSRYGQNASNRSYANITHGNFLLEVAERFKYVIIERRPYEYILERYDDKRALIYFDPPYVHKTRVDKNKYAYEWDDAKHIEAAEIINKLKAMVIVSGYESELYNELYKGWKKVNKEAFTNGSNRTEVLYLSKNVEEFNVLQNFDF